MQLTHEQKEPYKGAVRRLAALTSYPLTEEQVIGYVAVLLVFPPEFAEQVCSIAARTCRKLPVPADLLDIAANLTSPRPSAQEAYAEVVYKVAHNNPKKKPLAYTEEDGTVRQGYALDYDASPDFSHDLIELAVVQCGGWKSFRGAEGDRASFLKAQFERTYARLSEDFVQRVAETLPQVLSLPRADWPKTLFPPYEPFVLPGTNRDLVRALSSAPSEPQRIEAPSTDGEKRVLAMIGDKGMPPAVKPPSKR